MKTVQASEFKAKCLRILDEVAETGEPVQILKRGRLVARLVRAIEPDVEYPQDLLTSAVSLGDDLIEPPVAAGDWEADQGNLP